MSILKTPLPTMSFSTLKAPASGVQFADLDQKYNLPEGLLDSMWAQESNRGKAMLSHAGARGHFQFMPGTRKDMIKRHGLDPWSNDVNVAAECAAIYLSEQIGRFDGDLQKGLAAYNAGGGNVNKAIRCGGDAWLATMSKETRSYGTSIFKRMGLTDNAAIDYETRYAFNERRAAHGTSATEDASEAELRRRMLMNAGMSQEALATMQPDTLLGQLFFALLKAFVAPSEDRNAAQGVHYARATTVEPQTNLPSKQRPADTRSV